MDVCLNICQWFFSWKNSIYYLLKNEKAEVPKRVDKEVKSISLHGHKFSYTVTKTLEPQTCLGK